MLIKQVGVDYKMLGVAMHTTIQTLSKKGITKHKLQKYLKLTERL